MIKTKSKVFLIFLILILLSAKYSSRLESGSQLPQEHQINEMLKNLPLYFVENKGQMAESVKYHLKIPNANVYFTPEEIVYQFILRENMRESKERVLERREMEKSEEVKVENILMSFVGANERVRIEGLEEREAKVSYFRGKDPREWVSAARTYGKAIYRELYPHIDFIVYGRGKRIKNEYLVRVGGDVDDITIRYDGVERLWVNERGQLEIETKEGILKEEAPLSYQMINGQRVGVETEYLADKNNFVRFKVGDYRKDRELIIDPCLVYSTYLGGSGHDYGSGVAIYRGENVYVTGYTDSSDFPTPSGYDTSYNGGTDAFVTKLNSTCTSLIYSTYLGGSDSDVGLGIAVDGSGNAYVTGWTFSSDFPTPSGYDTSYNGGTDAFVAKLNSTGTSLLCSTYLGGSSNDYGYGIAVDGGGNAYVTGYTISSDFPTPSGYDTSYNGGNDAFITKLNSTGTSLLYSTYLGGSSSEDGNGIAVDGGGNAYVTGYTQSSNFPTTSGAYDTYYNGSFDAFITKLNSTGTSLLYSTYLGGSSSDRGNGIAVDGGGNAYATGYTDSSDFPTPSGYDTSYNGGWDAFVAKLNSTGTSLLYSTYLGGSNHDIGNGIAVDGGGNAYVTGYTISSDFPTPYGYDTSYNGEWDAFVAKLDGTGLCLIYATYLGGLVNDRGYGIAVDGGGNAYVTGYTISSDFPTPIGYDTSHNGGYDAFVTKITIPFPLPLFDGHDFNSDGASDISVFRPSTGKWYIKGLPGQGWGALGDIPVNGDYNGDNVTDIAVLRPSTGRWYIKGVGGFGWGIAGDIPVPGDYNGDNITDIAVWRPPTGRWYIKGQAAQGWGALGDLPVPGDYNGDGVTDIAVWRVSTGRWYIKGQAGQGWGEAGDIPVPADYNGDGVTDIAVFRPSTGRWYVKGVGSFGWGASGDLPVPGDYNGDGITDIAVWRPSTGRWYIRGQTGTGWGTMGDIPLVR